MISKKTERALRKAGWNEGRSFNTDLSEAYLSRLGYKVSPKLLEFLNEFGGLEIKYFDPLPTGYSFSLFERIYIFPRCRMHTSHLPDIWSEITENYLNIEYITIGYVMKPQMEIDLDSNGRMYLQEGDSFFSLVGENALEGFDNIINYRSEVFENMWDKDFFDYMDKYEENIEIETSGDDARDIK